MSKIGYFDLKCYYFLWTTQLFLIITRTSGFSDYNCQNHDECLPDEYCSVWESSNEYTSRCNHCSKCFPENAYFEESITGDCPSSCSCTSHSDCGENNYCSIYEPSIGSGLAETIQVCDTCRWCSRPWSAVSFDFGPCPDSCFCTSSTECPGQSFCSTNGESSLSEANRGVCVACSEQCVDDWVIGGDCISFCPNETQCVDHSDCFDPNGTITSNPSSDWCRRDHTCQQCNEGNCWTDYRLSNQQDYSNPYSSIDLACSESCCDWGLTHSGNSEPLVWYAGPCDASKMIGVGWLSGDKTDRAWTASEFKNQSQKCDVVRHEFTDGKFPPAVSEIDCSSMDVEWCSAADRTIAIWFELDNGEIEFSVPNIYPMHVYVNKDSDTCYLNDIFRAFKIIVIVSIILIGCCVAGCIWKCHASQQSGLQAGGLANNDNNNDGGDGDTVVSSEKGIA